MATHAELGSLATTLEELTKRVSALADGLTPEEEDVAVELFGIERALNGALRRLRKLGDPPRR